MKRQIFKIIAIISYLLIILRGEMIGAPFFVWLLFTLFDFGNTDQIFALLAMVGLIISFIKLGSKPTLRRVLFDIVCFMLLTSPIISRLAVVPIRMFNYLAFIIPTIIFECFIYFQFSFLLKNISNFKKLL